MKSKMFLTLGAAAGLALGFGPAGTNTSAQCKGSVSDCAEAKIAKEIALAEVEQAVLATQSQIESAVAQATTHAVTARLTSRITGQISASLARAHALQEQELIAAQAEATRPRISINGEDFSTLDDTGWMGVSTDDVSADRAKELKLNAARGVYVSEVEKDSPAEKAGLKSGDVITEFNGEHVEGVAQFRRLVRETPPGRTVSVTVWREGHSQTLSVTISTYSGQLMDMMKNRIRVAPPRLTWNDSDGPMVATPAPMPPARAFKFEMPSGTFNFDGQMFSMGSTPLIGISGESLSGQLGSYFGAPDGEGVLVREVQSGSPAEKGGLKAGDVITKLNGERVKTLGELQSKLRTKREEKTVQITVVRRGSEVTVTVEPNKPRTPAAPRAHSVIL